MQRAEQWGKQLEGAGFGGAMALFRQDHDNFAAALDASLASEPMQALELCRHLADFWRYAYLKREAIHYLSLTLHTLQEENRGDKMTGQQWASLHGSLANAYQSVQEYTRAHQHFSESLAYHDKRVQTAVDETVRRAAQRSRAGALHNLANNLFYENRFDAAERHYAEAATLNREMGNEAWLANNLNGLCHILGRQAFVSDDLKKRTLLLEQGLAYAEEAVALCRALPQEYFLTFMLVVQSDMLLGLQRFDDASTVVKEGFALSAHLENWEVVAEFLIHYHHLAFHRECWEVAAQCIGAAAGLGQRWNIDVEAETTHLTITDARRETLADLLGAERYDEFYQAGLQASLQMSLETLREIVSAI